MIPSIKTIMRIKNFGGVPVTQKQAKIIRGAMELADYWIDLDPAMQAQYRREALDKINDILGGCGVERIEPGNNARSPGILYVNMGDTYDTTVMVVRGWFRVGCWGDIVERGDYT